MDAKYNYILMQEKYASRPIEVSNNARYTKDWFVGGHVILWR